MQKILTLLAKQVELGDQLARLYGFDARRYAGKMRGEHRRDDHNLSWDGKMALEHRQQTEEEIRGLRAQLEANQKKLVLLIGQMA